MDSNEYLTQRVDDQIDWYDRKSAGSQKAYKRLRVLEIALAGLIPFLTGYVEAWQGSVKFAIGLMGVVVAVIAGVLSLYKFQENWVQYRSTCESLRSEKFLYQTQSAPYNTDQAFPLFVQKVETLLSKETSAWSQYITQQEKPVTPA